MSIEAFVRWGVSVPLALAGWWIIVLNFVIAYRWFARGGHASFIPLVGGFAALLGMGVCPLPQVQRLALIPLMIDVAYLVCVLTLGCGAMILRRSRGARDTTADPAPPPPLS